MKIFSKKPLGLADPPATVLPLKTPNFEIIPPIIEVPLRGKPVMNIGDPSKLISSDFNKDILHTPTF